MNKIETFDKNALTGDNVDKYFKIVIDDSKDINDIRFLILRFCIACEKVIDDVLFKFEEKNKSEIDDIIDLQYLKYRVDWQYNKLKLSNRRNSFASKIALMKSICDYKKEDKKYFEFLDFLREVRNIICHQFITLIEMYQYLIQEKSKFVYPFVKEDNTKSLLDKWIVQNDFNEILNLLLPIISIEIEDLKARIINYS